MTDRELKKLKRSELLELLVKLSEENEALTAEKESLISRLQDRTLVVREAGSIAEAALRSNGVFEDAQRAADQYLENARRMGGNAQADADALLMEAQRECTLRESASRCQCEVMLAETRRQCEALLTRFPEIRKPEDVAE